MLEEKDVTIVRDEILFLNSKGKRVKKKPRKCLGAFYFIEAIYNKDVYSTFAFIPPEYSDNKDCHTEVRKNVLTMVLKKLSGE